MVYEQETVLFKQQFIMNAMINFQNCFQDSFCPIIYFLSGFSAPPPPLPIKLFLVIPSWCCTMSCNGMTSDTIKGKEAEKKIRKSIFTVLEGM